MASKTHFIPTDEDPQPGRVRGPGSVIITACKEFDYVDSEGQHTVQWIEQYDPSQPDQITCGECRTIARLKSGASA